MNRIHTGKLRNMASIYLRSKDKLLLLYRQGNSIVSKLWIGSAGGHFESEEVNDARKCVLRELFEELSIEESLLKNLSLRYITLRYTGEELRQNYYFFADLDASVDMKLTSTEGIPKWFSISELDKLPMPMTARFMIDHYITTGQYTDALYGGITTDNSITFSEL